MFSLFSLELSLLNANKPCALPPLALCLLSRTLLFLELRCLQSRLKLLFLLVESLGLSFCGCDLLSVSLLSRNLGFMLLCLDTLALGLSFFSRDAGLLLLSNSETFCLGFLSCNVLSLLSGSLFLPSELLLCTDASAFSFCDGDIIVFTVSSVDGGDFQDDVGIDLEGDNYFGDTLISRLNTTKSKLAEQVVGGLVLALVDIEIKLSTVIVGGVVDLAKLDGNSRVTVDNFGHATNDGLNTKGQRVDIE